MPSRSGTCHGNTPCLKRPSSFASSVLRRFVRLTRLFPWTTEGMSITHKTEGTPAPSTTVTISFDAINARFILETNDMRATIPTCTISNDIKSLLKSLISGDAEDDFSTPAPSTILSTLLANAPLVHPTDGMTPQQLEEYQHIQDERLIQGDPEPSAPRCCFCGHTNCTCGTKEPTLQEIYNQDNLHNTLDYQTWVTEMCILSFVDIETTFKATESKLLRHLLEEQAFFHNYCGPTSPQNQSTKPANISTTTK
jgi:hypothetical protein